MRSEWFKVMGTSESATSQMTFSALPPLDSRHTEKARLLPSRTQLLHLLPKGGAVAEIGTHKGRSAKEIWDITQPLELHLFDLTFREFVPWDLSNTPGRLILHEGDSSSSMEILPDGYFAWIFIDGNHSLEGVRRDVRCATRKVVHDGYLVFNDYIYWSYLDQFPYGVAHAVHELCLNDGWEIVYLVLQEHMYCDIVIRRMGEHSM